MGVVWQASGLSAGIRDLWSLFVNGKRTGKHAEPKLGSENKQSRSSTVAHQARQVL